MEFVCIADGLWTVTISRSLIKSLVELHPPVRCAGFKYVSESLGLQLRPIFCVVSVTGYQLLHSVQETIHCEYCYEFRYISELPTQ